MSLPVTATDSRGKSITVYWAKEVELVEIRTDNDVIYLDPADARQIARHLEDAAVAAEIYCKEQRS